jgi:hypothetical protein
MPQSKEKCKHLRQDTGYPKCWHCLDCPYAECVDRDHTPTPTTPKETANTYTGSYEKINIPSTLKEK